MKRKPAEVKKVQRYTCLECDGVFVGKSNAEVHTNITAHFNFDPSIDVPYV